MLIMGFEENFKRDIIVPVIQKSVLVLENFCFTFPITVNFVYPNNFMCC